MDKTKIILLEDDPDDRFITESILKDIGLTLSIRFVTESEELFTVLKEYKPQLIIVDYNAKPDDGMNVLRRLKSGSDTKGIPVVILADSLPERHIKNCYEQGACSVILKPDTYEDNRKKIELFFTYWMKVVEL